MDNTLILIIAAGLIAVVYGIITRASLMKASTGNESVSLSPFYSLSFSKMRLPL